MKNRSCNYSDTIIMVRYLFVLIVLGLGSAVAGCEDPVPTDYVPQYVFTGYMIVDEPIRGIILTQSQAPLDTFTYKRGEIADAQIRISTDRDTFDLVFNPFSHVDGGTIGDMAVGPKGLLPGWRPAWVK